MKLLTLNVEGVAHISRVMPFIISERPDVICLQEAGTPYQALLKAEGYHVTFAPRCIKIYDGEEFVDSVMFATLLPHEVTITRFYSPPNGLVLEDYDVASDRKNTPGLLLLGTVMSAGKTYYIGTTHFTWAPNGDIPGKGQVADMKNFLAMIAAWPPHIMCGDFNIPRHYNALYANLSAHYRDEIPGTITSSLDPEFHRLRDIPDQASKLTRYMVDYIFSQSGYTVSGVRQVFGLSDHAGTVCEIV